MGSCTRCSGRSLTDTLVERQSGDAIPVDDGSNRRWSRRLLRSQLNVFKAST